MGFEELESYFSDLIGDIKGLFGGDSRPKATPAAKDPSHKAISSPGGSMAPIHGNWHSSGGFTYQPNPTHPKGHMGVDMRAPAGTPVYSFAPGKVTYVGTDPAGGNVVNVQHANGLRTYYAHLSTARVHKGESVDTNTVLGTVGNSGNAAKTFPHLHFQIWKDSQIQDPANYFSVPPYTNLSPEEKKQGAWLSEQAKSEAEAFSMKDYLATRRVAFSRDVDKLLKVAHQYSKLTKKL
jgi:murein DD-endopeptidase MepM/ murein hydrolase activator NlpD